MDFIALAIIEIFSSKFFIWSITAWSGKVAILLFAISLISFFILKINT